MEKSKFRKRLSIVLTFFQFIAMFLQLAKYISSQDTKVSGYNKILMNVICSVFSVYLKCSSHDKEFNNKYHLCIFTIRRIFVFGVFCYFIYIDSLNNFSSFNFNYEKKIQNDDILLINCTK